MVPQWVKAAPRAAAKAYVLRLNTVLRERGKMSAAAVTKELTSQKKEVLTKWVD